MFCETLIREFVERGQAFANKQIENGRDGDFELPQGIFNSIDEHRDGLITEEPGVSKV